MFQNLKKGQNGLTRRAISFFIVISFLFTTIIPPSYAQSVSTTILNLPAPGTMVSASSVVTPILVKGITLYPDNPLRFDFIVNSGTELINASQMKKEGYKQIKYFLAALTVPEKEMWVNLSPYEKDRIIPQSFGLTEMGRDLLAQDYMLKQLTSSLMYPEDKIGKSFWEKVYAKAEKEFGVTNIPVDVFHKIWIVPDRAVVYEKDNSAFVVDAHLKVMLEKDYLAAAHIQSKGSQEESTDGNQQLATQIMKEILIPEIEKEVNSGETFVNLRQVYNAMILATWFKKNFKESLLGKVYVDQAKTKGIDLSDKEINQRIYNQYLEAFQKGVYNYISEDYDPKTQQIIPKKYFSGGFDCATLSEKSKTIKSNMPLSSSEQTLLAAVSQENPDSSDLAMTVDLTEVGPKADPKEVEKSTKPSSQEVKPIKLHPFNPADLAVPEVKEQWDALDQPSKDLWITLRKLYDKSLKDQKDGKVSEKLIINKNFFPSATLTQDEREKLLGAIDYEDVVFQVKNYPQEQRSFEMEMTALDAGLGSTVRRSQYVKEHVFPMTGRDQLGAKGTDLGFDVNGRFVSVAEIKLLRLIKEVEEKKYPGAVIFQPIVSEIEEIDNVTRKKKKIYNEITGKNKTTYDEILHYPVFGQQDKTYTYEKKLKELNITMIPFVVKDYPSLKENDDLKPTFERGASASHGEWGFKFFRKALEKDYKSKGTPMIGFYNGDGTNNAPDPYIARWMLENDIPIIMISTTKTGIDKKGGQFGIEYLDKSKQIVRVRMLEQASAKANGQLNDFNEMGLKKDDGPQYFNTNVSLINYDLMAKILQTLQDVAFQNNQDGLLELLVPDLISDIKKKNGVPYRQLEGPIGTVFLNIHNYFETHDNIKTQVKKKLADEGIEFERILKIVNVSSDDREKFFTPIKESSDFWFQAHTNFYKLNTTTWMLENTFKGTVPPEFSLKHEVAEVDDVGNPVMVIDDETGKEKISTYNYYTDVTNLINAFGENADVVDAQSSLESLSVSGLVKFPNVKLRGKVVIINEADETFNERDIEKYIQRDAGELLLQNIEIRKSKEGFISIHFITADNALLSEQNDVEISGINEATYGGIDLNPELLDLQIKRDGNGVPLPVFKQSLENMHIEGFLPIIIDVKPAPSLPVLLGVEQKIPKKKSGEIAYRCLSPVLEPQKEFELVEV